ncbi:hypothetical protein KQX54_002101 [Cotesia glomerata]|uniref:DUF1279 domain-containing protein n=1 Tax=Cotesia glomerata TaxID=32391 RepID=A0AAV7ICC9_COTGL|nr:hypothetical protein KQX54_002101 [Cotesia glomerata]
MEVMIRRTSVINSLLIKSYFNLRSLSNYRVCACYSNFNNSNHDTTRHRTSNKNFSLNLLTNINPVIYNRQLLQKFSNASVEDKKKDEQVDTSNEGPLEKFKKLNVFQKMKQLFKDYWYIMAPVHIATSTVWVVIFYAAAKNGVDVIPIMEYLMIPDKYIDLIRNSGAGHWAVVYAMYKLCTPIRYTVTVGGTTMAIRYLDKMGYLKFKRPSAQNIRKTSTRQRHQASAASHSKKKLTQLIPKLTETDKEKIRNKI